MRAIRKRLIRFLGVVFVKPVGEGRIRRQARDVERCAHLRKALHVEFVGLYFIGVRRIVPFVVIGLASEKGLADGRAGDPFFPLLFEPGVERRCVGFGRVGACGRHCGFSLRRLPRGGFLRRVLAVARRKEARRENCGHTSCVRLICPYRHCLIPYLAPRCRFCSLFETRRRVLIAQQRLARRPVRLGN